MADDKPTKRSKTFKDLTGQRFGRLTVTAFIEIYKKRTIWSCVCDCGTVKRVVAGNLMCGNVRSCGCVRVKDITGQRFGRLVVVSLHPERASSGQARWECLCDCGRSTVVDAGNLAKGCIVSCGCFHLESIRTHGRTKTKEYVAWQDAKHRCFNPRIKCYGNYGGRGISMCQEWADSFETFFSDMGPCPAGMTLERVDVNGNYESGNCVWTTWTEQCRNKRTTIHITHNGETRSLSEWSELSGVNYNTLALRYKNGTPLFSDSYRGRRPSPHGDNS